jgi:hypothetical protein
MAANRASGPAGEAGTPKAPRSASLGGSRPSPKQLQASDKKRQAIMHAYGSGGGGSGSASDRAPIRRHTVTDPPAASPQQRQQARAAAKPARQPTHRIAEQASTTDSGDRGMGTRVYLHRNSTTDEESMGGGGGGGAGGRFDEGVSEVSSDDAFEMADSLADSRQLEGVAAGPPIKQQERREEEEEVPEEPLAMAASSVQDGEKVRGEALGCDKP